MNSRRSFLFPVFLTGAAMILATVRPVAAAEKDKPSAAVRFPQTEEQFAQLRRLIKPQPGESKWARVPWLTNLKEARRKAVALDRPLLLWRAGGGDVLGRA
jgi:hypothetical protein